MNKQTHRNQHKRGYTIVELVVTITIIALLATIVVVGYTLVQKQQRDSVRSVKTTIIAEALEKYYEKNGEYPSVESIASKPIAEVKQKLGMTDKDILVFPNAPDTGTVSIVATGTEPTKLVYAAGTTDASESPQCLNDEDGYCDKFELSYVEESSGETVKVPSRHNDRIALAAPEPADPKYDNLADNFNRTGTTLGVTSTNEVPWTALTGTWSTNGSKATLSSSASANPLAVVNFGHANADVKADIRPNDALYFRVKDATEWWRVREQTNTQSYTYYTQEPYTYYTSEPYTYYTNDPYTYYTYSYSPSSSWSYNGYWCYAPQSNGYNTGEYSYVHGYSTVKVNNPHSSQCGVFKGDNYGIPDRPMYRGYNYSRDIIKTSTAHTGYTSVSHTGYTSVSHTGYTSVSHTGYQSVPHTGYNTVNNTGYTTYYSLVLEKSEDGSISQVWAQPDTTTRPTMARVVANGNSISIYSAASGSPLTTVTNSFNATADKYGIGRSVNSTSGSGIDNFSAVKQ